MSFCRGLTSGPRDVRDLKGVGICAVGQSSVERFNSLGIRVEVAPAEYRPETIVEAIAGRKGLEGQRVLLPLAEGARDILAEELAEGGRGRDRSPGLSNRTRVPRRSRRARSAQDAAGTARSTSVTFGNPSTVREFADLYGADVVGDLLKATVVACVGPVTAQAARGYGITTQVVSGDHTNAGLVAAVVGHFKG